MRFWSVKKDLCCDNTNIFLIPPLKYKVLQNPNLLKVDFGKLNAVMSCQRTISQEFIKILDYVLDLTRIINYVNMTNIRLYVSISRT